MKKIFFVLSIVALPVLLFAQGNGGYKVIGGSATNEVDTVVVLYDSPEMSNAYYVHSIRRLGENFSGYAIELIASEHSLKKNHVALKGFGKIYVDIIDQKYHYLFPIEVGRKKSIKKFLKDVIRPRHAEAIVVQYLHGVRTKVFSW